MVNELIKQATQHILGEFIFFGKCGQQRSYGRSS